MTDFLHFIFPFAPETKERKLAREILAEITQKMEFVSDDQRKAVFANIDNSGDVSADTSKWDIHSDKFMTRDGEEPIIVLPGGGMALFTKPGKAEITKLSNGEHSGEYEARYTYGPEREITYHPTKTDAVKWANNIIDTDHDKAPLAKNYIRKNGKPMISKYPGKDIYGNSIKVGAKIIYSRQGIIKQ